MSDTHKLDGLINSYWSLLDDVKKLVKKMRSEPNATVRRRLNQSVAKLDKQGAKLKGQIQDEIDRLWKSN